MSEDSHTPLPEGFEPTSEAEVLKGPFGGEWDRRTLFKGAALGTAALGFPSIVASRALGAPGQPGANGRLTLGYIGVGGRGMSNLNAVGPRIAAGDLAVAAVCDVDENRLALRIGGQEVGVERVAASEAAVEKRRR